MSSESVLSGMLHKLSGEYGGKAKYKWDNRFTWLTNDGIYWSKKEGYFKIQNGIKLEEIESAQYFGQFLEYENVFFLYTKVKGNKKYFFACQTGDDCRKWVLELQRILQALRAQFK